MRLIDADEIPFRKELGDMSDNPKMFVFKFDVDKIPTIDPASLRPRGEWIRTDDPEYSLGDFECSACEYLECDVDTEIFEPGVNCLYFCPNCGADMRTAGASSRPTDGGEHDR